MPDKTDWEALMDGAFGRRSRPAAETSARRDAEQARRELEELMARQPAAPAALQKNAARLADAAADQAEQIRRLGGEMTENLRRDGLLPQEKTISLPCKTTAVQQPSNSLKLHSLQGKSILLHSKKRLILMRNNPSMRLFILTRKIQ